MEEKVFGIVCSDKTAWKTTKNCNVIFRPGQRNVFWRKEGQIRTAKRTTIAPLQLCGKRTVFTTSKETTTVATCIANSGFASKFFSLCFIHLKLKNSYTGLVNKFLLQNARLARLAWLCFLRCMFFTLNHKIR
jgi:hypothetical protein